MYCFRFLAGILGCWMVLAGVAAAQGSPGLRPEAAQRLAPVDTLLHFRTRSVPGGRIDMAEGVWRAAYRLQAPVAETSTPEAAARSYLRHLASSFGWTAEATELHLVSTHPSPSSYHLVFQQTFAGLPVYQRRVKVNLDARRQPTMVLSAYAPHLRRVAGFNPTPTLAASAVGALVQQRVVQGAFTHSPPQLVVWPSRQPRLAWHLLVWPQGVPAEWSVLLDAHTGELLHLVNQATHAHAAKAAFTPPSSPAPPSLWEAAGPSPVLARVDGTGLSFDPDPLSTAGQSYGGTFTDNNDADAAALNNERLAVTLPEITRGTDGLYRLEGPYVRIIGQNNGGTTVYQPPAEATPDGFAYTRSQEGFEAVNAYYHLDKSQRYVQALGFSDRQNAPLDVNPQSFITDESFYFPGRNMIGYGTGSVDDAEDATVLWHEYGHALLEAGAPGLLATTEGAALHEGWADYWAVSYIRHLTETGAVLRTDWRRLFKWDSGDGQLWSGRVMDSNAHYPEDTRCDDPGVTNCSPHNDGRLWATVLMQVYDDLGRTVTDELVLHSHRYLSAPVTFRDAAEAVLQADIDLFGGAHGSILLGHFDARGLIDVTAYGPRLTHTPLPATEQLGGTIPVVVETTPSLAPVDSVLVFWTVGAITGQVVLAATGDGRYEGNFPLPLTTSLVTYYVEAVDVLGRRSRLPEAPDTYQFAVGPDTEPPQIVHDPFGTAALAAWPLLVVADVTDNLGVDAVFVDYTLRSASGLVKAEGTFPALLQDGLYCGTFPVPVTALDATDQMTYRVRARDRAGAANEASLPATGTFTLTFNTPGPLLDYGFEGVFKSSEMTGTWARALPSYGLQVARTGRFVWGTPPDAAYTEASGQTSFQLPPLNLQGLGEVYLVFWHWYDLEHNGEAEPGTFIDRHLLWDGANVKVSTNGGTTWTLLTPEDGYDARIVLSSTNPLANQQAFGGYSAGWRRSLVRLPEGTDVRVRFDLGTDDGNTEVSRLNYAGWRIDDVSVVVGRPVDQTPPVALTTPAPRVLSRDETAPLVTLQLRDDTGVGSVYLDYELVAGSDRVSNRQRLTMRVDDLETFETRLPLPFELEPGDQIRYRITAQDFDGNVLVLPNATDQYVMEVQVVEAVDALAGVRPSGLWEAVGSAWVAEAIRPAGERSSLVLAPLDLPANAGQLSLALIHHYDLGDGLGGNLKLTADGGRTWTVLAPSDGYPGRFQGGAAHPMQDEAAYVGSGEGVVAAFDLLPWAGQQVQLRLDLGTARTLQPGEFWTIEQVELQQSTTDTAFDPPPALKLLPNFPDPFSTTTTISYTLPEILPVTLEVYDVLGRRVQVLCQETQHAGTYTHTFDGSTLASGVYLVRLLAGTSQRVERMVVAR
jgi:hypothetical protein